MRDPGVLILGVHRSGTSAMARLLDGLGLDAGPAESLIGPTEHNPHGHFEVHALVAFNDRLLAELGGSWVAPPPREPDRLRELAGGAFGTEAAELLDDHFGGQSWFWKDPRNCLLLPFWLEVLDAPPVALVVVRHPDAVSASLEARDGVPVAYGRRLWSTYLSSLSASLDSVETMTVVYDLVLADAVGCTTAISDWLGVQGHAVQGEPAGAASLIDPAINHHSDLESADFEGDSGNWSRLLDAHGTPFPGDIETAGPAPSEVESGLARAFGEVLEVRWRLVAELADWEADVERAVEFEGQRDHLAGLAGQAEDAAARAEERAVEFEGQRDHLAGLAGQAEDAAARAEERAVEFEGQRDHLAGLAGQAEDAAARAEERAVEFEGQRDHLAGLAGQAEDAAARAEERAVEFEGQRDHLAGLAGQAEDAAARAEERAVEFEGQRDHLAGLAGQAEDAAARAEERAVEFEGQRDHLAGLAGQAEDAAARAEERAVEFEGQRDHLAGLAGQAEDAAARAEERAVEFEGQRDHLAGLAGQAEDAAARAEERAVEFEGQRDHLAGLAGQAEDAAARAEERAVEFEGQRDHLAGLAGQAEDAAARAEERAVEFEGQRDHLAGLAAHAELRTDDLRATIDELVTRERAMLSSRSWRLTRPLRWLAAKLRGWAGQAEDAAALAEERAVEFEGQRDHLAGLAGQAEDAAARAEERAVEFEGQRDHLTELTGKFHG